MPSSSPQVPDWAASPTNRTCIQDLPPPVTKELLEAGRLRTWKKDDVVVSQGQMTMEVVASYSGRFAARLTGADGDDTLLGFLDHGEMVGIATVLADKAAPTGVVAMANGAQTLHISKAQFVDVLTRYPDAAIKVAALMSARLMELFRFVEMTSNRSLSERVAFAVSRLAVRHGERRSDGSRYMRITQSDIAKAAGASRQRVHIELKRLQARGQIVLGYGTIVVKARHISETG